MEQLLAQTLILLGTAIFVVVAFHHLKIPSSLGYILVGVLLGSYTPGPVIASQPVQLLAEFGIVFLLFTIGLNFSLPQIHALRGVVLGLGTAQVALTTAVVGAIAWFLGLPVAAAFVVGAVFAQSSTTIISRALAEQGEEHSRHGRMGIAMSVFQDVTAVPILIVIPVLGSAAAGAWSMAGALGVALAKAALAFVLVFVVGRRVLLPLFRLVALQRSAEVFTLTVLFVSLVAAWVTQGLGMSTAFGAFLAGMVLGETEFRHQVESTIRPFRDVLLGLFFVGIGMLLDPAAVPQVWHLALAGAAVLVGVKAIIVSAIARLSGIDAFTAWRVGWILSVGGEFGFALLAIALGMGAIDERTGQVALTAVLFSMIAAPFLIRYHAPLARLFARGVPQKRGDPVPQVKAGVLEGLRDHVVVCGYGRIGQAVAHVLEEEGIACVALDLDPERVRAAHTAGERVFYGDSSQRDILEAVGIGAARLLVVSHEDLPAALKVLHHARALRPDLPVMVRTRDERHVDELRAAGATEVVPETLEASLMIAAHALVLLDVPLSRVARRLRGRRDGRYHLLREFFRGEPVAEAPQDEEADRLRPVVVPAESPMRGRPLGDLPLEGIAITALVRGGQRHLEPPRDMAIEAGDVVVLFGSPDDLGKAERALFG